MSLENYVLDLCINTKSAKKDLNRLSIIERNNILKECGKKLLENEKNILSENQKDISIARKNNLKESFIERLTLNSDKIKYMADTLVNISNLSEVLDQYDTMTTLENGLMVGKKRVPLGVVLIIFESRPNVTVDSFALCLKTGNVSILRGGKEAINTTMAIVDIFRKTLAEKGINENIVQLVTDTNREIVPILTKQNKFIDVVIPRGSNSLIQAVIQNSTVPVIETGVGNCHVYVDKDADFEKAIKIINNAKTQRVSVCNAMESMLVHKDIANEFLPKIIEVLDESNVEYRCCAKSLPLVFGGVLAKEEDFETEFLDYIVSIKIVNDIDEAIEHIDVFGTNHSECIVSENYSATQKFLKEVDAAVVYANASTRFTDGDMFGFGGEIGISTQKLHARGPMGLKELTTYKYVVYGDGQVRQ